MINDKFDDKTFNIMKLTCLETMCKQLQYKTLMAFSVNRFNTLTILDKNT